MKNTTINLSYFFYLSVAVWLLSFIIPSIDKQIVIQVLSFFYIFNISASVLLTIFLLGANKAKLDHQLGERKHTSNLKTFIVHIVIDVFVLWSITQVLESNYTKALFWFSISSLIIAVVNKILFERIKKRAQK